MLPRERVALRAMRRWSVLTLCVFDLQGRQRGHRLAAWSRKLKRCKHWMASTAQIEAGWLDMLCTERTASWWQVVQHVWRIATVRPTPVESWPTTELSDTVGSSPAHGSTSAPNADQ